MAGEAREKCAVGGVLFANDEINDASAHLYEVMFALQHRGDEASGMATMHPGQPLAHHRDLGMVKDVYDEDAMRQLTGSIAVGHGKYTTSGRNDEQKRRHVQPVIDESLGMALSHNGNIPDTTKLDNFLTKHNLLYRHRNDSEKMGHSVAQFMRGGQDFPTAIESAYPLFDGAFSCVGMHDDMLVAFRDPKGIRPLALGHFDKNRVVSSETCGLDILNAKYDREIKPGELVIMTNDGKIESRQLAEGTEKLDIFEYVYFARHDSELYGQSVNEVRRRFGQKLAEEHGALHEDTDNVVVVPVPDTSVPIAEGYAESQGLRLKQAIIKNRYIGRTFMQPTPDMRERQLRRKHNIISEPIKGRDVILIDDSIVRLNTIPNLVQRAYAIGAKSVSVLIGSPPVRFPDFYGIDTPSQDELAAANMTTEQMRNSMHGPTGERCKYLGFQSIQGMVEATGLPAEMFNLSCFNGEYPIDIGPRNKANIRKPVSMEYAE